MIVIDHENSQWILLRNGSDYFMEVTSGVSYQPVSMVVKLDEEKTSFIRHGGRRACQYLAGQIADDWDLCQWADEISEKAVYEAINAWRESMNM